MKDIAKPHNDATETAIAVEVDELLTDRTIQENISYHQRRRAIEARVPPRQYGALVNSVELAGLPAPPTSHTLHFHPSTLPLPFPFPNYTAGNLEIPPDLFKSVSNSLKYTKVT